MSELGVSYGKRLRKKIRSDIKNECHNRTIKDIDSVYFFKIWDRFVDWVQDPVLLADPSLADEAERDAKKDLVVERLGMWSRRFAKIDIVTEAQKRHVPASPVSPPLALVNVPQLIRPGFPAARYPPALARVSIMVCQI